MMNRIFSIDPSTLRSDAFDPSWLLDLYKKYHSDLALLCAEMAVLRKRMIEEGYSADFSDRESEVLYLVLREFKPEVVVEISPCHGYSTNYILAALTANGRGQLHSFEIQESFHGKSTVQIIQSHLNKYCDAARLTIHIGDVMKADIPKCDFLFLDSCHEAYFSRWYFSNLMQKSSFVFIHDILIFDNAFHWLVPKAAFLGIREQCYTLESLALNKQKLFSVAEFDRAMPKNLKQALPARFPGASERSIAIQGHVQSKEARALHETQIHIEAIKMLIATGNRVEAERRIREIFEGQYPLLSKLDALGLLVRMGYRYPLYKKSFHDIKIHYDRLTVAELVSLFEIALNSYNFDLLQEIIRESSRSGIVQATREYIIDGYMRMAHMSPPRSITKFHWKTFLKKICF